MKETILIKWYFFEIMYTHFCLSFFDDSHLNDVEVDDKSSFISEKSGLISAYVYELEKVALLFIPFKISSKPKTDRIEILQLKGVKTLATNLHLIITNTTLSNSYFQLINQILNIHSNYSRMLICKFGFT